MTPLTATHTDSITVAAQLVAARSRVAALADQLGHDELAVIEAVAVGLASGRAVYGELQVSTDRRHFTNEATAEIRDSLVYLGAQLIRLQRLATTTKEP